MVARPGPPTTATVTLPTDLISYSLDVEHSPADFRHDRLLPPPLIQLLSLSLPRSSHRPAGVHSQGTSVQLCLSCRSRVTTPISPAESCRVVRDTSLISSILSSVLNIDGCQIMQFVTMNIYQALSSVGLVLLSLIN